MKENKYDNAAFFEQYKNMARSLNGLEAAGEWHELQRMLPDFNGKRVLDLGCGFGWHCRYAVEHGATAVVGVDLSEKMLEEAGKMTTSPAIQYVQGPIEDFEASDDSYDVVISSLALHYVASFRDVCAKVFRCLKTDGVFVFSVEHPIFTAQGKQDWHYDAQGRRAHWPVDAYAHEGMRRPVFLGEEVVKYHKTLATYFNGLIENGLEIMRVVEPTPSAALVQTHAAMQDEFRRPMMLLISATKGGAKVAS